MKQVVLGASGAAGSAITMELVARGIDVRAVNRNGSVSGTGIEPMGADLRTQAGVDEAVAGAEVVYMAAQPAYHRWPQEFPSMIRRVIEGCAKVGSKLVMVDNLYVFGRVKGPMSESTPERAVDRKGVTRRTMDEALIEAHRRGDIRVAIGRSSDYFGPAGDNSGISAVAIIPAVRGKGPRWLGSFDVPHSAAFLPDVAKALVELGVSPQADGEVWHLPHEPAITGREFLDLVSKYSGVSRKPRLVSEAMLRLSAPFHTMSRETLPLIHQWTEPFVVDDSKFRATFCDFETSPLVDAIRSTIGWYRANRT